MLFNKNGPHLNWAPLSESADSPTVGAGRASTFKRGEDGAKEKGEEREGGGGIIIEREMCYPQGLLLIASLMSLWDELVVGWIWMQLWLLRGGESPLSRRQLSLTLVFPPFLFLSFLPDIATCLPGRTPPSPPSEVARLWWIGILWVSNPLCGSLMSQKKNSAAPASSRRFSIKGKFSSAGVNFH